MSSQELPIVGVSGVRGVGKTTALRALSARLTAWGVEHQVIHPLDLTERLTGETYRALLALQDVQALLDRDIHEWSRREQLMIGAHRTALWLARKEATKGTLVLLDRTFACCFAYLKATLYSYLLHWPEQGHLELPPLTIELSAHEQSLNSRPHRQRDAWDAADLYPSLEDVQDKYRRVRGALHREQKGDRWEGVWIATKDTPSDVASALWDIIRYRWPSLDHADEALPRG